MKLLSFRRCITVQFDPIGIVHTCFKEKFGIPRQSNLVREAPGRITFYPAYAREETLRGLEGFSHIWVLFVFHDSPGMAEERSNDAGRPWSPMVRPPRLGGNKKVGVFASRSPFRPNPIGMSAVRLTSIELASNGPVLHLSGVDILDGTPVLDIKPYVPYADMRGEAVGGFAGEEPPKRLSVTFSKQAMDQISATDGPSCQLLSIIEGVLENDPRPAYKVAADSAGEDTRIFGIRLFDFDLKWYVQGDQATVISLEPV